MNGVFRRTTFVLAVAAFVAAAAQPGAMQSGAAPAESTFDGLRFRNIGPATMGGRVDDFAVLESNPSVYYVAMAIGGLWKTTNNGTTFEPIFQNEEVSSVGDVAIAANDANLVWVGTGENNNRQSSSWGGGIYKSTDGGRTWKNMGLADTRHIARVIVDPVDHDVVYVAALGHLWGPNKERGIFKTSDGGLTWSNVLFVDNDTGATELVMDPSNNKVLYAATYQRRRATWGMNGGGPGSAIYKSTDAGRTWTKLTKGIPSGPLGRIGLDVYRKDPRVVYARIQHETESGVYRSDDGGASWTKMSSTNPRPMYFSQIRVDPNDDHRIYVLGVQIHISDDGGKTFVENGTLHSDHHAFWIDPGDSNHVMTGNDGGIGVSWDRGEKWDFVDNMPAGQFYHVSYDMETPYNVYGGLQDNYSWGGPSAVRGRFGISNFDWFIIGGGDGFVAVADPRDSRVVYTESQGGNMVRTDRVTFERKTVKPTVPKGDKPLRWNWDTPLFISPHNPDVLYTGANMVFRSGDRGHSWTAISGDLTTGADRDTFSLMGVQGKDIKISKNDGISSYPNLTALAESPKRAGLLYAGAEDGSVQVTRDGGKSWQNVSNKFGAVKGMYVSRITPSAADEGTVYLTFDNHRENDYDPYVFVSTDSGNTWRSITSNLPKGQAVHCITEDLKNPNVLYVGTEFGLFVSLDRGAHWTRMRSNLPTVPIYEITQHPRDNDLILATHGRSIWILDDLSPIQRAADVLSTDASLFDVRPAMQMNAANDRTNFAGDRRFWGENPKPGAAIAFYLKQPAKDVKLTVKDAGGAAMAELIGDEVKGATSAGINRVYWDLKHEALPVPRGVPQGGPGLFPSAGLNGPFVLPGEYRVTLAVNGREVATKPVRVAGDRLIEITDADRKLQHDTALALHELHGTANEAAAIVSTLGDQFRAIDEAVRRTPQAPAPVKTVVDDARTKLTALRRQLGLRGGDAGDQEGGGGGGGGNQAVRNQISQVKNQVIASTSAPTEMQMRALRELRDDLDKVITETNAMITSVMPGVYKTLGEHNLQPATLKPLRTITSSQQQQ
jgi:photosystem II stability/assembly factor-like uncharacterized protein